MSLLRPVHAYPTLALACAALLAGARPSAADDVTAEPLASRVAELVREGCALEPGSPGEAEVVRALAGLGAPLAEEALALLAGAPLAAPDGDALAERLDAHGEDLLVAAVARLPVASVAAACARLLDEEPPDPARRVAAVRLLAPGAGADELLLLLELASGTPAVSFVEPVVLDVLRRDERAFAELERVWGYVPADLKHGVLRAVGLGESSKGLTLLVGLLGRDAAPDGLVLAQIGRLAPTAAPELADRVSDAVRPFLASHHAGLRQAAALALGKLGDDRAVPELIALLEDEAPGVVSAAHWALKEASGLSLPASKWPWTSWYHQELVWQRSEAREAFRRLRDPRDDVAVAAVREISARRLARHHLAAEVAGALDHPSARVRIAVCEGLAALASRVVAADLAAALADEDEGVRAAAHAALRRITELDLGPERAAWDEALLARR